MHYVQITKNQTAKLSSLIQEAAKYASEIAELARDCAEDGVQYAEIVTMKRQISVYERYRTNVQHEIDLILDSLRENIRFAKNDIAALPDDDDLLFATTSAVTFSDLLRKPTKSPPLNASFDPAVVTLFV